MLGRDGKMQVIDSGAPNGRVDDFLRSHQHRAKVKKSEFEPSGYCTLWNVMLNYVFAHSPMKKYYYFTIPALKFDSERAVLILFQGYWYWS